MDFKALIALLQASVDEFGKQIPKIQNDLFARLRREVLGLVLKDGNIVINAENIKKIAATKAKLLDIILSSDYVDQVKKYVAAFNAVTNLQNAYFKTVAASFSPPDFGKELKSQAIQSVVDSLTEKGMQANVLSGIEDILRRNITSGGPLSELEDSLKAYITNDNGQDGILQKYTRQITTDAINQYSAQYTQIIASDLGLEWFKYAGSNLTTTRPWCLAMTKKQWVHISEFPRLLRGDFPEFDEFNGKLYRGLPAGMIPDTTPANLSINRGGYNCGHQLRPVSEGMVPIAVREAVYATEDYRIWRAA